MQLKSNDGGFTLVELVVAVALLSAVLSALYYFSSFSMNAYNYTQAQYKAELDARKAILSMGEDIREAKKVSFSGINHKAVEIQSLGMAIDVYTDIDDDDTMELVQYKIVGNKLKKGVAELGSTPASWKTIVNMIYNDGIMPKVTAFTINGKQININLIIGDETHHLEDEPISIVTSIAVRSKGGMD